MILCDIGNTNAKIKQNGKICIIKADAIKDFDPKEKVFFINVNHSLVSFLKSRSNFIDLKDFIDLKTSYKGLGIDRAVGCCAIENGAIVDVGSAITIDIMEKGVHKGGPILPGIRSLFDAYLQISPILKTEKNLSIDLLKIPQNTSEAINLGVMMPIVSCIKEFCKDRSLIFTGGDAKFFLKHFSDAKFDDELIFKGMQKIIKNTPVLS